MERKSITEEINENIRRYRAEAEEAETVEERDAAEDELFAWRDLREARGE